MRRHKTTTVFSKPIIRLLKSLKSSNMMRKVQRALKYSSQILRIQLYLLISTLLNLLQFLQQHSKLVTNKKSNQQASITHKIQQFSQVTSPLPALLLTSITPSSLFCLFPPVCPRHLRSRILFWATLSQLIIFSVTVAVQESRGWEPFPSGMKDGFEFKVIPGADNNNWYKAYYKCQNETVNTGELVTLENINSISQSPFDFLMERVRKQFGTGSPSGFYVNAHKFLFGSLPSWSSGSWATSLTIPDEMACYCVKTDGILYNLSCGEISSEMVTVCQRKKLNREQKIGFVATENPANWAGTRGRASWLMGKMSIMNSPCWYLRLEGKRNWYEGVRDCNRLGSQLLSITESDTSEFNELETKFDSDSPTIFVNSHRYLYG